MSFGFRTERAARTYDFPHTVEDKFEFGRNGNIVLESHRSRQVGPLPQDNAQAFDLVRGLEVLPHPFRRKPARAARRRQTEEDMRSLLVTEDDFLRVIPGKPPSIRCGFEPKKFCQDP